MRSTWTACIARLILGIGLGSPVLAVSASHGKVLTSEAPLRSSYDYVIVGGGVSGLTVANRLSENPSKQLSSLASSVGSYSLFVGDVL
jgi:hypothetical protein